MYVSPRSRIYRAARRTKPPRAEVILAQVCPSLYVQHLHLVRKKEASPCARRHSKTPGHLHSRHRRYLTRSPVDRSRLLLAASSLLLLARAREPTGRKKRSSRFLHTRTIQRRAVYRYIHRSNRYTHTTESLCFFYYNPHCAELYIDDNEKKRRGWLYTHQPHSNHTTIIRQQDKIMMTPISRALASAILLVATCCPHSAQAFMPMRRAAPNNVVDRASVDSTAKRRGGDARRVEAADELFAARTPAGGGYFNAKKTVMVPAPRAPIAGDHRHAAAPSSRGGVCPLLRLIDVFYMVEVGFY